MSRPFNNLTFAEAEALALLAEEAGEIVQACAKALRHGLDSEHPDTGVDNRTALQCEIGDLFAAVDIAAGHGIVFHRRIRQARTDKLARVAPYLHHAKVPAELSLGQQNRNTRSSERRRRMTKAVVTLRLRNMAFEDIAARLGITYQQARQFYWKRRLYPEEGYQ